MNTKRKIYFIATLIFVSSAIFTSCIKEEALNAEADIEKASIENAKDLLQVEPLVTNDKVTFRLRQFASSYMFAPEFVLTEGATIEPASGATLDFLEPQTYTVTSEDGMWKKKYTVEFVVDEGTLLAYTFENVDTVRNSGKFHKFFDYSIDLDTKKKDWDSGNLGFDYLTIFDGDKSKLVPSYYPTSQSDEGYIGKSAVMVTKHTGDWGIAFKSPIAAGSLYLGNFELDISNTIESTHFGQPYTYKSAPKTLSGYFKYKAGEEFEVNNEPSNLEEDMWDAYAILFEKEDKDNFLTGSHDFKDTRMVSVARLPKEFQIETDEWTPFEMSFEFEKDKSFDPEAEYMFTIVFSSSAEGAKFNGAVGSTLYIDEVRITLDDEAEVEEEE